MPWRILLVEDDAMISALLADLLVECGHHVCGTARTETQAVAAAERLGPNLMIVDAQLQTGRGIAAMETILRRTAMLHHRRHASEFSGWRDRVAQAIRQGKLDCSAGERNGGAGCSRSGQHARRATCHRTHKPA
jgi:chemotaxis response regulator CheB